MTMLCQSVMSFHSPVCASFWRRPVASENLDTDIPLAVNLVSASLPRFPSSMTLLTLLDAILSCTVSQPTAANTGRRTRAADRRQDRRRYRSTAQGLLYYMGGQHYEQGLVVRDANPSDHRFLALFHVHAGVELQVIGNAGPIDRRLHAVQPHRRSIWRQPGGMNVEAGCDRCGLGARRAFLALFHGRAGVELQVIGNAGPIDRRLHAVQPHRRSIWRQPGGMNVEAGRHGGVY